MSTHYVMIAVILTLAGALVVRMRQRLRTGRENRLRDRYVDLYMATISCAVGLFVITVFLLPNPIFLSVDIRSTDVKTQDDLVKVVMRINEDVIAMLRSVHLVIECMLIFNVVPLMMLCRVYLKNQKSQETQAAAEIKDK